MLKAIKYTRVSTASQDLRGSKEIQEKEIEKWAIEKGYIIVNSFSDTDHGDDPNRPGINEMKQYLMLNSDVKYVIVLFSDRFTRDFRQGMQDLFFLEDLGVKVISVNDGTFDSLTSMIKLMGAQEEKRKIVKKTTDSMFSYALDSNRYLGGSLLPFFKVEKGLIDNKKCKLIVKNIDNWEYYRNIFVTIIKNRSISTTSKNFDIPISTLREWVNKPELIGYRTFGKKGKMGNSYKKGRRKEYQISDKKVLPQLLTDEEFETLTSIWVDHRSIYLKRTYPYLLSSLLNCACGGRFAGNRILAGNKKSYVYYYRCEKCKKPINAKKLEKNVKEYIINDTKINTLLDYEFRVSDYYDSIMLKEQEKSIIKKQDENVLLLLRKGLIDFGIAEKDLSKTKVKLKDIDKEIKELKKNIEFEESKVVSSDLIESLKFLLENYDDNTLEELKEILNLLIKKIEVKNDYEFDVFY